MLHNAHDLIACAIAHIVSHCHAIKHHASCASNLSRQPSHTTLTKTRQGSFDVFSCQRKMSTTKSKSMGRKNSPFFIEVASSLIALKM